MSGLVSNSQFGRANMILCCLCGTKIYPNAANQCGACLAQQYDLHSILRRGPSNTALTIHQCRKCRRYERTPTNYIHLDPESPELLSVLLKKIPALQPKLGGEQHALSQNISRIKLMDAMWVWTEPNCMRMKLRLTVTADIDCSPGTVQIQQRVLVEFIVKFAQCPECNREYTNRTWHAIVQLRQKRGSDHDGTPKGLLLLETAIAKNPLIRKHVLRVVTTKNGFDFYFLSYAHAQQFTSFLSRISPLKTKATKKMVSEDVKNNTANMKWTISADVVPLCRDDLVLCTKGSMSMVGKLEGRMALVTKVTSCVHLVDATPVRGMLQDAFADLHPDKYWKGGGRGVQFLLSSKRLERFVVMDVELCDEDRNRKYSDGDHPLYKGPQSGIEKYALADVEVVRESDFNESFRCVTHLGNLLHYGDIVLGYDLTSSVLPNELLHSNSSKPSSHSNASGSAFSNNFVMPDIVLVKKVKGMPESESNLDNNHSISNDNNNDMDDKNSKRVKKGKAKSSASKKRERRRQKQAKKEEEMEKLAARMGFIDEEKGDDSFHDVDKLDENAKYAIDKERAAFEKELENDPELKHDLELAERELNMVTTEVEEEEEQKKSEVQVSENDEIKTNANDSTRTDRESNKNDS